MKKSESPTPRTEHPTSAQGMTLEEIRLRKIVNSMKIQIEKERLMTAVIPGATPAETAMQSGLSRIENIMSYITLGITAFRLTKKAVTFFKSFRKNQ